MSLKRTLPIFVVGVFLIACSHYGLANRGHSGMDPVRLVVVQTLGGDDLDSMALTRQARDYLSMQGFRHVDAASYEIRCHVRLTHRVEDGLGGDYQAHASCFAGRDTKTQVEGSGVAAGQPTGEARHDAAALALREAMDRWTLLDKSELDGSQR